MNDKFGHRAGDEYIIRCAKALDSAFSQNGSVYRIGGDEFFILLNGKLIEETYNDCTKDLEQRIKEDMPTEICPLKISLSYGAAIIKAPSLEMFKEAELIADEKMYKMKKATKAEQADLF